MEKLTLEQFEQASEVVNKVIKETNLVYSDYFSEQTGNQVYLKPENIQFTGAYKVRGAYTKSAHSQTRREQKVSSQHQLETMRRAWLTLQRSTV